MIKKQLLSLLLFLFIGLSGFSQQNVFLDREYWKANPSIDQIEKDIAEGNDVSESNSSSFDAVTLAILQNANTETIKHLLSKDGNDVNKITHDSRTYIFWAASAGNLPLMEYLVQKGAKTNIVDSHGLSILNFAASTGQQNLRIYDFILAHGGKISEKDTKGASAILLAAHSFEPETELLAWFLKKGYDIKTTDSEGNGIFNYAAKNLNPKVMEMLISRGVEFKNLNKTGGNAFLFATQGTRGASNDLEAYRYLEKQGLDANVTTTDGRTPLHILASRNKNMEIFNFFLERKVDINKRDKNGNTAIMNAAMRNDIKTLSFLSEAGAEINTANKNGETPLMLAMQNNTFEVVEFLISNKAEVSVKDKEGNSLAYYLITSYGKNEKDFNEKLAILKSQKFDFSQTQANENSLWHLAAKENNVDLAKQIYDFNIPINSKNSEGYTPLHLAAMKATDTEFMAALHDFGADKTIQTEFGETALDLARENEVLAKQKVDLDFLN